MHRLALFVFGLCSICPIWADDKDSPYDGVWKQYWLTDDAENWNAIGLVEIHGEHYIPWEFTFTSRDVSLPIEQKSVKQTEEGWQFLLVFAGSGEEGEPKRVPLRYNLNKGPDGAFFGTVQYDGKKIAETRFEPLPTRKAVRQELKFVISELKTEKKISDRILPELRENAAGWEKRLAEDRKLGRSTVGSTTSIRELDARIKLANEETRLATLEGYIITATERLVRLEEADDAD